MPDIIETAIDKLSEEHYEELMLKLLSFAGPPPQYEGGPLSYGDWSAIVERGTEIMYPYWHGIDHLDATIQFRHWCNRRGAKARRKEKVNKLVEWVLRPFKERT